MDLLSWIADERRRVADLLDGLGPAQLATPSLCSRWTVHEVAAHLLMPLVTPMPRAALSFLFAGLDFDRANLRLTAAVARRSAVEIADGLRRHAEHRFAPPGKSHLAPLTDLQVHQQDIRRPLGLPPVLDPERLRVSLDWVFGSGAGSGWRAAAGYAGLRFEATDLDWGCGSGPTVRGSGEALLLARTGRRVALADLDGEGAEELRSRLDS